MRTWHYEMSVVAVVLSMVCLLTHGGMVEWIGAGAVLLAFGHANVADRLAEQEAKKTVATVHCYRWLGRYFVGKEVLWFVYFILHHSWSALVGVGIFLVYPLWRQYHRRPRPT
jgi:hypothetical protein